MIADRANRFAVKMPSGLNSRCALTVKRVRPACRLARLFERISGKHRYHAVRQIDAGSPRPRGPVQRRSRSNEVSDVGDVDAKAPVSVFVARKRDGVVEVASGRRVDRDRLKPAQVLSGADFGLVEEMRLLARLFENGLVESVGDIERPDDAQRVDSRLHRAGPGSRR